MPRRLKVVTREMGPVELQLIYQTGDEWEAAWAPLQPTAFAPLIPVISDVIINHAIRGWTKPFVTALGLPPQGALRKIPPEHRQCEFRGRCPFYTAVNCIPTAKKLPNCFQPVNLGADNVRILAYEAIRLWREGVYVVVVTESSEAYRTYPRAL